MKFLAAVPNCFKKYASIEGTTTKTELWGWLVFFMLMLGLATAIDGILIAPARGYLPFEAEAGRPLATVVFLALLSPTIAVIIRRLHHFNLSGWWILVIPAVALAIVYWPF